MTLGVTNHTDSKNRHTRLYTSTVKNLLKSTDLILCLKLYRLGAETTHEERVPNINYSVRKIIFGNINRAVFFV